MGCAGAAGLRRGWGWARLQGALNRFLWLGGGPDPQASLLGQTPVLPKHPVLGSLQ